MKFRFTATDASGDVFYLEVCDSYIRLSDRKTNTISLSYLFADAQRLSFKLGDIVDRDSAQMIRSRDSYLGTVQEIIDALYEANPALKWEVLRL